MRSLSPWPWGVLTWVCMVLISGAVAIHPTGDRTSPAARKVASPGEVLLVDDASSGDFHPLPPNVRIQRHVAGGTPRVDETGTATDDEFLIYSNTLGNRVLVWPADWPVADDLTLASIDTCELSRFLVRVNGGVPGGGGEFQATVSLYDVCPGYLPWGEPGIPGTELTFYGLSDDKEMVHELVVDYSSGNIGICNDLRGCRISEQDCIDGSECVVGPAIDLPRSVWLQVVCNTDSAGWVGGARAELGYTTSDYYRPFNGCGRGWFGGYPIPPFGGLYAQIYVRGECPNQHTAFRTECDSCEKFIPMLTGTENVRLADDLTLVVSDCELSRYEIRVIGEAGPYTMEFELREHPTLPVIPGTERTFFGQGTGSVESAAFTFEKGIHIPRSVWIVWRANRPDTFLARVGRPYLGSNEQTFAQEGPPWSPPGEWDTEVWLHNHHPAVSATTVYCHGDGTGACCYYNTAAQTAACLDNVSYEGCLRRRWLEGVLCDDELFDPPCATHAEVVIETVTVGNPGNGGELSGEGAGWGWFAPDRICGAVDYVYNISKFEVTAGQYTEFLNAVADTDTHGLYNTSMWSDIYGCKIERTGSSGSYTYGVAADWADRPVNFVSWGDAARFANWLHNGQPTGAQGLGLTEDGSYFLDGATSDTDLLAVRRKPDATWVIPSEDEWYKAAYHGDYAVTGDYFGYPTSSDTRPSSQLIDPDPGNNVTYTVYTIGPPYYRTEVGAHESSDSPYGTFDQGGNVMEWNENILYGSDRVLRGGSFSGSVGGLLLHAASRFSELPTDEVGFIGFRVAEALEPGESGDLTGDGDVNLNDFALFAECHNGPGAPTPPPECTQNQFGWADIDGDEDVDLQDFRAVQRGFTEPPCRSNSDCIAPKSLCHKAVGNCYGSGACSWRTLVCTDEWDPVCGCDGTTYSNYCYARSMGANVAFEGDCHPPR